MKLKKEQVESSEAKRKPVTENGKIEKKKNKKDNFEVRIPRIIVRNLDFKINEEKLRKAFEKCTTAIKEISVVSKDGQSKGFGFITFEKLEDAQKAVQTMNGQKLLKRPMAVDWSLPKNVYQKMHKPEPVRSDSYGIQSAPNPPEVIEEEQVSEEEEEEEDEDEEEEETPVRTNESSRDVREHRTLFVRNIPYDASEEELSLLFSSNGQRRVHSCRLVIDPVSRHPRGSAFIQFASNTDAEECLPIPFTCHGQELQVDLALGRNDIVKAKEIREQKKQSTQKSDQRNLNLANYGVILNLSDLDGNETDLRKRQNLEDVKKQKLKNPFHFISSTRLTVHNLPTHVDDEKLRQVVLQTLTDQNVPKKDIQITECRVMKKTKESKKSLGFGFLNFTRHELALRTIDVLNNNKYIFGPTRRPIVQFAVENRRALQLQEQRRERLHAKQELFKDPTKKVLAFESEKKKKQREKNQYEQTKNQVRLSELIQQEDQENEEEEEEHQEVKNRAARPKQENEISNKKKRVKSKSKGEVRDQFDRMVSKSRNKPQLPQKSSRKWFE